MKYLNLILGTSGGQGCWRKASTMRSATPLTFLKMSEAEYTHLLSNIDAVDGYIVAFAPGIFGSSWQEFEDMGAISEHWTCPQ